MTAHHLFAPSLDGDRVEIAGDDAHHAVRVLRLRPGERVTVSDGAGLVADGIVQEAARTLVVAIETRRRESASSPRLIVAQGIPKAGKFETIVQKLTELGVDEIVPFAAARSVARWDAAKVERMRAVGREAAKQSRRAWLPAIANVAAIDGLPRADLTLVLHEHASAGLLESLPGAPPASVAVVVGPEGGLEPAEVEELAGTGVPVSLGRQILRTETAALVACTLILGHFGRIG